MRARSKCGRIILKMHMLSAASRLSCEGGLKGDRRWVLRGVRRDRHPARRWTTSRAGFTWSTPMTVVRAITRQLHSVVQVCVVSSRPARMITRWPHRKEQRWHARQLQCRKTSAKPKKQNTVATCASANARPALHRRMIGGPARPRARATLSSQPRVTQPRDKRGANELHVTHEVTRVKT